MREDVTTGPEGRLLSLRLVAEPVAVPTARRFVADALSAWGLHDLLDDATLCVSELARNAALHGSGTFLQVGLRLLGGSVRISVEDDGAVPAAAVVPRPSFPDPADPADLALEDEATTGRGLAIVSLLASDWGVQRTGRGKRVWCDLAMPRELCESVEQLQRAVSAADVHCEEMRLLTLASFDDLKRLRRWMTEEVAGQARDGAAPTSWQRWLVR